ncbi:hypothetical protein MC885_013210 [Smutsia gigantea]|nr:hypothetical protein MC885_013210 [Smutsia gigantea]
MKDQTKWLALSGQQESHWAPSTFPGGMWSPGPLPFPPRTFGGLHAGAPQQPLLPQECRSSCPSVVQSGSCSLALRHTVPVGGNSVIAWCALHEMAGGGVTVSLGGWATGGSGCAVCCRLPAMSTLMDIKSSVLRQVHVRPPFRRRADEESGSRGADPKESTEGARKPGDGVEFFAQMRLILKKGEGRQGLPCPEVLLRSDSPAPAEPVDPNRGLRALTQEEEEMIYEEALYTVLHRAGTLGPDQVDDQEALLGYLQQVFGTSREEHAKAVEQVKKAKAPRYALKVSVMRAKNLLAKDPNGFSDPYCMLGILPASGSPREPGPPKEQRFSFRGGSKRSGPLPAKRIQVTEVKSSTLNPIWKEHFILDHDDDVSVVEACRKLNEVIGLKGMSRCARWDEPAAQPPGLWLVVRGATDECPALPRYFKQIVKSARTNGTAGPTEDHTDDFLGCLNIPIREVPVAGEDRWFKLEPRSSASRVQGDCQLVLKLVTTQVGS